MCRDPFSEDLKFNKCVSDRGFNKLEMYLGVSLLRALYVITALLYLSLFSIDGQF